MAQNASTYPAYARSERIADGILHVVGLVFALVGSALFIIFASLHLGAGQIAALSVYGAALVGSFVASAIYHFTPWEGARPLFRRIDHAAIYLKIAGTYTPLVVLIGSAFAYGVLAVVWVVALFAAGSKLFFWRTPGKLGPLLYLALGWASVLLIWPLVPLLPMSATILIVTGGLLYSSGVIFFSWDRLRFSLAIWHGFVLAASICFFTAIGLGVFSA